MSITVTLKTNDKGDVVLPLHDEVIEGTGWKLGDKILFSTTDNGGVSMKKLETELVLIEAVSMFRMRYVVEVPKGERAKAVDLIRDNSSLDQSELIELSQEHIDECITSSRVITEEEYLNTFDEDNSYLASWNVNKKLQYINKGYDVNNVSVIEEMQIDSKPE